MLLGTEEWDQKFQKILKIHLEKIEWHEYIVLRDKTRKVGHFNSKSFLELKDRTRQPNLILQCW